MTLNQYQFSHAQWNTNLNIRRQLGQEIAKNRKLFPLPKELVAQGFGKANGRTRNWLGLDKTNPNDVATFNDRLREKLDTTRASNASYTGDPPVSRVLD